MKPTVLVLLTACLFGLVTSLALPAYLKPCKKGKFEEFNDCVLKTINNALPTLVKGDRKYRLPVLDPLLIKRVSVSEDNKRSVALNVTLEDAKLKGLKNSKVVKSEIDLDKKHIQFSVTLPKLVVDSKYSISGKFLILPITGTGPAHIVLDNVKATYTCDFKLIKIKGEDFIKITKWDLKYDTTKLQIDLKNLFNGDEALGKNMNKALNENWSELNSALGPSIAKAFGAAVTQILDELTRVVSYKEAIIQ
ncbi:protein takeout-like [Rhodnius prolixus]|uniref:Hemolymph juvenile hormone binding protein n=1 Tax=Rhodnius prolixus TaxID=13249 RepID=A0ABL0E9L3_RHOPR